MGGNTAVLLIEAAFNVHAAIRLIER